MWASVCRSAAAATTHISTPKPRMRSHIPPTAKTHRITETVGLLAGRWSRAAPQHRARRHRPARGVGGLAASAPRIGACPHGGPTSTNPSLDGDAASVPDRASPAKRCESASTEGRRSGRLEKATRARPSASSSATEPLATSRAPRAEPRVGRGHAGRYRSETRVRPTVPSPSVSLMFHVPTVSGLVERL